MKRRFIDLLVIILLNLYFLTSCNNLPIKNVSGQNISEDLSNKIDTLVNNNVRKANEKIGNAFSISVMDNGQIIYSKGFGEANRQTNEPVTSHSPFNIGSVSKIFAAVSTMLLVDEGKLNLDERVIKYLPEFTMKDERYKDITVRMLLNHSAGLPGGDMWYTNFGYEYNPEEKNFLLETLKASNLKHDPGFISIYSNNSFDLIELLIEKVSGQKFIDFVQKRICTPLNLTDTGPSVGECDNTNVAKFYHPSTGKAYPDEVVSLHAMGGLSASTEDLCKFGQIFCLDTSKNILSYNSLNELTQTQDTPFSKEVGEVMTMGLGWDTIRNIGPSNKKILLLFKDGETAHYYSEILVIPDYSIVIALTSTRAFNNLDNNIAALKTKIVRTLLENKESIDFTAHPTIWPPKENTVFEEFAIYEGDYINSKGIYNLKIQQPDQLIITSTEEYNDVKTYYFNNGYFVNNEDNNSQLLLKKVNNTKYILAFKKNKSAFWPEYQELHPDKDNNLMKDLGGKLWLIRKVKPYVQFIDEPDAIISSKIHPKYNGYINFIGLKKVISPDYASFSNLLRHQTELNFVHHENERWANINGILYSPEQSCKLTNPGDNVVIIGEENYSEWLKVTTESVLTFNIPSGGRIGIFNKNSNTLYDSIVDNGSITIPAGSYIECIGKEKDIFTIISSK